MKRKSQRCKRNDFGNLAEPSKMEKLFLLTTPCAKEREALSNQLLIKR